MFCVGISTLHFFLFTIKCSIFLELVFINKVGFTLGVHSRCIIGMWSCSWGQKFSEEINSTLYSRFVPRLYNTASMHKLNSQAIKQFVGGFLVSIDGAHPCCSI